MATGMVSAPFPTTDPQTASTSATAQTPNCGNVQCESGDKHDSCMSGSADHQAVLEEVRRTVLEEVDAKLGDKMKDLWSRGNKMLKQIEQEN